MEAAAEGRFYSPEYHAGNSALEILRQKIATLERENTALRQEKTDLNQENNELRQKVVALSGETAVNGTLTDLGETD